MFNKYIYNFLCTKYISGSQQVQSLFCCLFFSKLTGYSLKRHLTNTCTKTKIIVLGGYQQEDKSLHEQNRTEILLISSNRCIIKHIYKSKSLMCSILFIEFNQRRCSKLIQPLQKSAIVQALPIFYIITWWCSFQH